MDSEEMKYRKQYISQKIWYM